MAYFPRGFGSYTLDCKKYPSGSARIPVTLMEMDDAVVLLVRLYSGQPSLRCAAALPGNPAALAA